MSAAPRPHDQGADTIAWQGHEGPVEGRANGFDVIDCQACGFRHAVPLPDAEVLTREYAEAYYRDAKPSYLADASADRTWARLAECDRLCAIERAFGGIGALIEIGSGPGFFLEAAEGRGWSAIGIEPSRQAAAFAQGRGRTVYNRTFEDALSDGLPQVHAVAATNVLEHVREPLAMLETAAGLLRPGGVACITVPNDFNPLQRAARDGKGHDPWWIAAPHHLNYFDFASLEMLLLKAGLQPVERLTSFPMEAFLLMGDDYVRQPQSGRDCHVRRMNFDLSFQSAGLDDVRRLLYGALASSGIGREATVIAVKL